MNKKHVNQNHGMCGLSVVLFSNFISELRNVDLDIRCYRSFTKLRCTIYYEGVGKLTPQNEQLKRLIVFFVKWMKNWFFWINKKCFPLHQHRQRSIFILEEQKFNFNFENITNKSEKKKEIQQKSHNFSLNNSNTKTN